MAVRVLRPADLQCLHRMYNRAVEGLGHGFPALSEEFEAALLAVPRYVRETAVLVAEAGGAPVAFARVGIFAALSDRFTFSSDGDGLLFGPFFARSDAAHGAAVLSEALQYLSRRGVRRVAAFDPVESVGFPFFNAGWCGLSERLADVLHLYARAGFRIRHRELCLTRLALPPPECAPSPGLRPADESMGGSKYASRLLNGGAEAGVCYYSRVFPSRGSNRDGERWGYIDGLTVHEPYRGRGLSKVLMARALAHLAAIGCGPVCLTTGSENYRAQNLYLSLGFAVVDSCVTLTKEGN